MSAPNIILIIIDSLNKSYLGCCGNSWVKTPNLDNLAKESILFTKAYAESLPTIPVRKALFTGTRTFPFRNHEAYKGNDFTGAPGWGPIPEEKDTISEILREFSYRTMLITGTYHLFKPSHNFQRGFDEWICIRGQEVDRYRARPQPESEKVLKHIPENLRTKTRKVVSSPLNEDSHVYFHQEYLKNVAERHYEEGYFPAKVFREAAKSLERNRDAKQIFMVIDSFDPHEPWDPPKYYREIYDKNEEAVDFLSSVYGSSKMFSESDLNRLRANYAGEVTLVDHWLGFFIEQLKILGLFDDTLLIVVSDYGHNIGEHNIVGKQGYPMTREVADLVLMIRYPKGIGKGTVCDKYVYNFDIPTTILSALGIKDIKTMEGKDIWSLISGKAESLYDHVTCGWGPFVMVRDNKYWYNDYIWGEAPLLYDLESDPNLTTNIADKYPDLCEKFCGLAIVDAGGNFPEYLKGLKGDPGCTPLLTSKQLSQFRKNNSPG